MANVLDNFPRFLLERCQHARARGITRFKLTHRNGDLLFVILGEQGRVDVRRFPRVTIPDPIGRGQTRPRMKLATTEAQLQRDILEGITSQTALEWRG